MNENEQYLIKSGSIRPSRSVSLRILRWFGVFCLTIIMIAALALGGLYLRLQSGPLSFSGMSERVSSTLSSYFEYGWKVTLRDTALELDQGSFALRIRDLEILNAQGRVQLRAPNAIVSVDTLSLLVGRFYPKKVEFIDLQAIGTINDNGSVTFIPTDNTSDDGTSAGNSTKTTDKRNQSDGADDLSQLSQASEVLLEFIAGSDGPLGVLEKAQLTNLRLILVDSKQQVRARFSRVDASFERAAGKGRVFEASLNSERGRWSLKGDVKLINQGYALTFQIDQAPVQDLILLSGLSTIPATTTLRVSGLIEATLAKSALSKLEGTLQTGDGRIDIQDKDATPLLVNSSSLSVNWNETNRRMDIPRLEFRAGETHFVMSGNASFKAGEPWRLSLAADNAILNGVASADKPVRVDRFEAEISGNGVIAAERVSFQGPELNALLTAKLGNGEDPKAITADITLEGSAVRSILRLWPEVVSSAPRRYLIANLIGGRVEQGKIKVSLSGDMVKEAVNGGSIPDEALRVDMTIKDGQFITTSGIPPLSKASADIKVTGRTAAISGQNANVVMQDGRSLKLPTIMFTIDDFWPRDAIGMITADIDGGVDAVASFLNLPKIKEAKAWDLNPADVSGHASLKLGVKLAINNVPKFADIPVTFNGKMTDVVVNKALGPEKLEKATFSIDYNTGALAIKGEGQLAGYPASINLNQAADGKGSRVVLFSLDDAARTRRGVNFGSQLTGTIPIKVISTLAKDQPEGYQVEADLTKVSINNLVPGWTKSAGKAGKVSMVVNESDSGIQLRDIHLEGGITVLGKAILKKDGSFESAELSSFQLSQGDDMQVKVEKNNDVYKIVVRGNLGDARPVIRALTTTDTRAGTRSGNRNSSINTDLDIAVNILTGFNDETLTKSAIKVGIRGGSLRQLQASGQFGSSVVSVQTSQKTSAIQLVVQAENAGSLLRYLDIYRRMYGGDINFDVTIGERAQYGYVMLHNFIIRNEPALKRIVPSQTQGSGDKKINVNDASFTKARVEFARKGSVIELQDGAIWGTQIGFTFEGQMDFTRNQLDVSGTFVPAYGLNNAFAKVPIFGTILGGGQYGGLFGVNFRLNGAISAPSLTVNPLSAVAPGIFRKLFGTGGGGGLSPN